MIVYANTDYYKLKKLQEETMRKTHEIPKNTESSTDCIHFDVEREHREVRENIP